MNYVFIAACVLMIAKLVRRRLDFYSIGAICHMIYNFHCVYGVVFISSHEVRNTYYYHSEIDLRVYLIVLVQMLLLYIAMSLNDQKPEPIQRQAFLVDKLSDRAKYISFVLACAMAWIIMLYNVMKIGVSNLTSDKSYIWTQVSGLYITGNWLGMAVFTYGLKEKKHVLALLGMAPVLLHFFFGSRAYFAALGIVVLLIYSDHLHLNSAVLKRIWILLVGIFGFIFIFVYKRVYLLFKSGDFSSVVKTLTDPETYAYISRLGEPRIVLSNLNYIIEHNIKLNFGDLIDRIISIVPFLNNFIRQGQYRAVSSILRLNLNSSYGIASNIWGEYYALGSYPLVLLMFLLWLRMLKWGNSIFCRRDWSAMFYLPIISYLSFYIHRLDFVKIVGNIKMDVMAMILFVAASVLVTRNTVIVVRRQIKRSQ